MKRIIFRIIFCILLVVSLAPVTAVHANAKFNTPEDFAKDIESPSNNSQTSNLMSTGSFFYTISCFGDSIGCTSHPAQIPMYFQKSAVGFLSNSVALTFATPPADLGVWIADTGQSLGFIPKQAYAQGIGFSGMLPLLPIWKVFRNVAYLLMAAVMVIIGFMVMFRKKIDPKTVVTAQNAIPRVIIALILITFSYAIVGFVIDIMYVAMALVAALFKSTGYLSDTQSIMTSGYMSKTFWVSLNSFSPLKLLFGSQTTPNTQLFWGEAIGAAIAAIGAFVGFGPIIGLVVGAMLPLIYAIYAVMLLFLWIRLLFFFISAYIQIILALLIAPLQLLGESFPGSNAFSSWFKNLIANVAVFPIAAAMFMLSAVFLQFSNNPQGNIWVPPYAGLSTSAVAVAAFVSIGLLFAIQPVCSSIKEALKAKPVMPMFDTGGAGGSIMQTLSMAYYIKSLAPKDFLAKLTGRKPQEGPSDG